MGRPKTNGQSPLSVRERRRWWATLGHAHTRIRELEEERRDALREVAELRQEIAAQAGKLEELADGVASVSRREQELRAMLLGAHDQLMRRAEEIKVYLASDLRTMALSHDPVPQHQPESAAPPAGQPSAFGSHPDSKQSGEYPDYPSLVRHVQEVATAVLPSQATVAVVSKGDDELLKLGGDRSGWHFPQNEDGVYAGFYPADSKLAIAHLEELRARGADHLLFPETAFWWLERYEEFARHLDAGYRRIWAEGCIIYALGQDATDSREDT